VQDVFFYSLKSSFALLSIQELWASVPRLELNVQKVRYNICFQNFFKKMLWKKFDPACVGTCKGFSDAKSTSNFHETIPLNYKKVSVRKC
jgi:hypothetical protein